METFSMIPLLVSRFGPNARPDIREPKEIGARMTDDAVTLRRRLGYIDFADLRALGWTRAQLEEHGRIASIDAVRRVAFEDVPPVALSDDDFGCVCLMAALIPDEINLSDECAVMLHLAPLRFPLADIARLLPETIAKARELRCALVASDPCQTKAAPCRP
jgi:hypothetical protein